MSSCFEQNTAGGQGGAIFLSNGITSIGSSTFVLNQSGFGGAVAAKSHTLDVIASEFVKNVSNRGAALYARGDQSAITQTKIEQSIFRLNYNTTAGYASAVLGEYNDVIISKSRFESNRDVTGAACVMIYGGSLVATNSEFIGNQLDVIYTASALFRLYGANYTMTNCVISGNKGNIFVPNQGIGTITNCTIAGNEGLVVASYDGFSSNTTNCRIGNSIIARNGEIASFDTQVYSAGGNLFEWQPSFFGLLTSDLRGVFGIPLNPQFVLDPGTTWPNTIGDLRLKKCSKAINIGINTNRPQDLTDIDSDGDVSELLPLDLDNNVRIYTGQFITPIIDAGAYEFQGMPSACAVLIKEEEKKGGSVVLYPNPNNGVFSVKLLDAENALTGFRVYNKMGDVVQSELLKTSMDKTALNLSKLGAGIYIFEAIRQDGTRERVSFQVK